MPADHAPASKDQKAKPPNFIKKANPSKTSAVNNDVHASAPKPSLASDPGSVNSRQWRQQTWETKPTSRGRIQRGFVLLINWTSIAKPFQHWRAKGLGFGEKSNR